MAPSQPSGLPCPNSSASFWHSEPNAFLLNHRTTSDLPSHADVIIIGSGITGANVARYLAESSTSFSVLMLEAREVCWGATGRNGGHCQPLLFDRSPDVAAFEVRNVAAVKDYITREGIQAHTEWRDVTACRTFWDEGLFDECVGEIEKLRAADPETGAKVRIVQANEQQEMKKHRVRSGCVGVTLTEGAAQLWPYKLVTYMIEKLVRDGELNVQTNTPVLKLSAGSGKYRHSVETPRGSVEARHVVLATNGYTSALLPESFTQLIVPVRHEMSALHPPAEMQDRLPNSYGMVGYAAGNPDHDDYLIHRPFNNDVSGHRRGGHLMFGGGRGKATYGSVGISDDNIIDPGSAEYLYTSLPKMLDLGSDKPLVISHVWTGVTGYSIDNMPWVGRVPVDASGNKFKDGMWLCGGYTGHGMPNATLCAKAVVEMLLGEEAGESYDRVSERLLASEEISDKYLITKARLEAVKTMKSVAEQEQELEQAYHDKRRLRERPSAENGRASRTCHIM